MPSSACCAHCGLTVRADDLYCCYGCEIAAQIAKEGAEEHHKTKAILLLSLLLSMTVMMLSLFLFSEDVYDIKAGADLGWLSSAYRVASGVLSLPVVLLLGIPIAKRALKTLRNGRFSMDLLIAAGAFAAYGISVFSIFAGRRGVYFDSASSALLLSTLGRYLEAVSRSHAARLLGPSLGRRTEPVKVFGTSGFEQKAPALIAPGDRLSLGAEEVVPVDALLLDGSLEVNLGVLTGESVPLVKRAGDEIPAGAVIVSGPAHVMALRCARDSTLERLSDLAMKLSAKSTSLERWSDRFAAALTPIVVVIALGTLGFHTYRASAEEGVIAALAVVLSACPCTYGVATPLVFWLTLRKALSHGVLIRSAAVLEELNGVHAVAFDKTGTLTDRALSVENIEVMSDQTGAPIKTREEVLALLADLEEGSRHPVGAAIFEYATSALAAATSPIAARPWAIAAPIGALTAPPAPHAHTHFREKTNIPGKGIRAVSDDGQELLLGSQTWLASMGVSIENNDHRMGRVRVVLAKKPDEIIARIHVGESLRPEAKAAISGLAAQGISAFMLTGDSSSGATPAAAALGIQAYADLSAEDKVRALTKRGLGVAMVGDGMNDAPALAGTKTSFAMFGGTDLARGMAQISLLTPDLRLVPWTIALAKRAFSIARTNLIASTIYNLIFLALASVGLLRPVWAGLSMAVASLVMLASASRMRTFRSPFEENGPDNIDFSNKSMNGARDDESLPLHFPSSRPFVIADAAAHSFAREGPV